MRPQRHIQQAGRAERRRRPLHRQRAIHKVAHVGRRPRQRHARRNRLTKSEVLPIRRGGQRNRQRNFLVVGRGREIVDLVHALRRQRIIVVHPQQVERPPVRPGLLQGHIRAHQLRAVDARYPRQTRPAICRPGEAVVDPLPQHLLARTDADRELIRKAQHVAIGSRAVDQRREDDRRPVPRGAGEDITRPTRGPLRRRQLHGRVGRAGIDQLARDAAGRHVLHRRIQRRRRVDVARSPRDHARGRGEIPRRRPGRKVIGVTLRANHRGTRGCRKAQA